MSRDKLLSLLWPEGSPESVRHRLNVLVYDLRKTLGREAITSLNDDLRLSDELVWVDVGRFLDLIGDGHLDQAVELYRGPFLDGFHLPDSPEFGEWAEQERSRLAAAMARALEGLAESATRQGAGIQAVDWWRQLVELDPLATRATVGLMQSLAVQGETAEALRAAQEHARRRASDLDAPPDATVHALADQLRQPPEGPAPLPPAAALPAAPPVRHQSVPVPPSARTAAGARRSTWLLRALAVGLMLLLAREVFQTSSSPVEATAAINRVVILPFVVRGDDQLSYLAEGMAQLLSLTMDGVGGLRTADPHAVLARLHRTGEDVSDPAAGQRIAADFTAASFVLGTVVESGDGLEFRASLYGVDGALLARASAAAVADAGLNEVVDELTRQLISQRYAGREDRLTRLAVNTSASVPALRAYLLGESRLRAGEYEAAAEAFRDARQVDSTFALAWYRLAVAAEWALQPFEAAAAVREAVRHASRLPERDRLLLGGWQEYVSGQADQAEATYRRILDLYPDELEAWLQRGEIAFHYAASRGGSLLDARAPFERVLELDGSHEGARVHLARIAAHAGDRAQLDVHANFLIARDPASTVALEMRLLRAFAAGDSAEVGRLRPELTRIDSYAVLGMLLSLFYARDWDGVEWIAGLLRTRERPVEVQTAGHLVTALVEMGRGASGPAGAALARAEVLDPARSAELGAMLLTLPFIPFDSAGATASLRRLTASPSGGPPVARESFFLPDPNGVRPVMTTYLMGLLRTGLGDAEGSAAAEHMLREVPPVVGDSMLGRDLAAGIRAERLLRAGDVTGALAALEAIQPRTEYQLVLPSPFQPRLRERFLRALLLESTRPGEAMILYRTVGNQSLYDLPYRAPALLRLAALSEASGETGLAAEYRYQAMRLWADPDPAWAAAVLAKR